MKNVLKVTFAAIAVAGVTACTSPTTSGTIYTHGQTMTASHVQHGTITSVRNVEVRATNGNDDAVAGALLGGVVGALAGDQFGKGNGNKIMTGVGAIAGASIGSNMSKNASRAFSQEWIVKLDSGSSIAIVQQASGITATRRQETNSEPAAGLQ